jgi:hypothetical protein
VNGKDLLPAKKQEACEATLAKTICSWDGTSSKCSVTPKVKPAECSTFSTQNSCPSRC